MLAAGCDVGSLTAEAVILVDGEVLSSAIRSVGARVRESAEAVMGEALEKAGLKLEDLSCVCATGYGREGISFADFTMSEISCHGLGAFWCNPSVRSIIDVGGQDCKAICVNDRGMATDFVMNDKCAAGTGRSLEILARAISLSLEELGPVSLKSRRPVRITSRCSLFMELEVLGHFFEGKKVRDIAGGINGAVARRVAFLAQSLKMEPGFALTGGVSKNAGVARSLEKALGICFLPLSVDPQLMGALGAAIHALGKAGMKEDRP